MSWMRKASQTWMPPDLYSDLCLLDEERQWHRAVTTPSSLVKHDRDEWIGKVLECRGDPVNGGMVLVEHELKSGIDKGSIVQRFYPAFQLSPALKTTRPENISKSSAKFYPSYSDIGHKENEQVLLWWYTDGRLLIHLMSDELTEHYVAEQRHGIEYCQASGRIELDNNRGSVCFEENPPLPTEERLAVVKSLANAYPGVKFYVYVEKGTYSLQQYWELLSG